MTTPTLSQQFFLESVKREVEKISDIALLRQKYVELTELHIQAINTYSDLLASEWGIKKND